MRKLANWILLFSSVNLFGQTSYFLNGSDGTRLYVRELGKGKPVVLLAGGPGLNAVYMASVTSGLSSKYR